MLRGDATSKSWPHTAVDILQLLPPFFFSSFFSSFLHFFFFSQRWGATLVGFGSSQWE